MCFSPTASFGASAVISVIGAASFLKATDPPQRALACIPIFFAIQQFIEGFVWLSVTNPNLQYLHSFATYAFLGFALVIWPSMIPLSALLPEPERKRRQILMAFLVLGLLISLCNILLLVELSGAIVPALPPHQLPCQLAYRSATFKQCVIFLPGGYSSFHFKH
jgi:hypothetical protein